VVIIVEIKDLAELKEIVSGLVLDKEQNKDIKNIVTTLAGQVGSLTDNVKKIITEKGSDVKVKAKSEVNEVDYDLDQDGKVTSLEIMVVRTLQTIATSQQRTFIKGQKNSLLMLVATLVFLSLQVIFAAFGIPLS
jgi:hypothetical protein